MLYRCTYISVAINLQNYIVCKENHFVHWYSFILVYKKLSYPFCILPEQWLKPHCWCLFQLESSTLNWFEAQEQCRGRDGLTMSKTKSNQSYWTGTYRRITPWIKIIGLYQYFIILVSERFKTNIVRYVGQFTRYSD